ncbi:Ig-like domain-containing protein [Nonlabens xiamenensis]|uniref:Ig-like domain-containing protein n=1 Tax=Nonlabens xiamenensis TaxID=2341043 RepID=UPI000F60BF9B|nr:Ig-like domain-containing protein [Nonlabens xiamenensis]
MKKALHYLLLITLIAVALVQCAKKGTPTGGPIDETPPAIVRASPPNFTTNFSGQEIEIQFNEYVKLKELQKQLVISPPLKTRPLITPQGSASKKINITITDTLKENTTYVFDFGQSIVDNNEENPYPFFKYVFSTGPVIDSLTLKGEIIDAIKFEPEEFVNVLLYEVNESYTDSIIYNGQPNYVLNTLDSLTTFTMENLKEGTYKMVALKEDNRNLSFNPGRDKIGFVSGFVKVPSDTVYTIKMYDQELDSSIKKITQEAQSKLFIGYTGDLSTVEIQPNPENLFEATRLTSFEDKDTLQYWFRPALEQDSLLLNTRVADFEKEFKVRIKELKRDSLSLSKKGELSLRNPAAISATTPINTVNTDKISLIDKDSLNMEFTVVLDSLKNLATFKFPRDEDQRYTLQLLPGAITDFYGSQNLDTLALKYSTRSAYDYGNIFVTLVGSSTTPLLLQVVKKDLSLVAEQSVTEADEYEFNFLDPGDYYLRLVYDRNDNGRYDGGNFLQDIQPERVVYYPDLINLLKNFDRYYTLRVD